MGYMDDYTEYYLTFKKCYLIKKKCLQAFSEKL